MRELVIPSYRSHQLSDSLEAQLFAELPVITNRFREQIFNVDFLEVTSNFFSFSWFCIVLVIVTRNTKAPLFAPLRVQRPDRKARHR